MPILVVQMGHCYRKSGATGTPGEQDYATRVATACRNLLHGRGGWVVRAILADDAVSLYRGDAFVAIHCDGSTSATARGASIGYRTPEGQAFGQAWKRAYDARGWDSGFRPDNYTDALRGYYGVGNAMAQGNRRAFIAECGFLTNGEDRAVLNGNGGPERVALSIGDALGIPVAQPGGTDVDLDDQTGGGPSPLAFPMGPPLEANTVRRLLASVYSYSRQAAADSAAVRAAMGQLTDDEANVLAAIRGSQGAVLNGLASVLTAIERVDGTPSDAQVAKLGDQLSALLPPAIATQLGQRLITPVGN